MRVATACLELPGASPLEFLRGAPGARGFWARGERWIAHTGTLAVVTADPGPDRFRQVWDAAAGVVGEPGPTWPADADPRAKNEREEQLMIARMKPAPRQATFRVALIPMEMDGLTLKM